MKTRLIAVPVVFFSCLVLPVMAQNGFTNKAEAKNEMQNGLKEGKWVEYMDSNDINSDTTALYRLSVYKGGKPCEISRAYYKASGKVFSETPYTDGKKNGVEKYYFESGKLEEEDPYTNDVFDGLKKEYYENGQLKVETPYSYGVLNGVERDYFDNGKLEGEITYSHGGKNGVQKVYYENGKVKTEVPYYRDRISGIEKEYYESGIEKSETKYINNKAGETKDFDEKGKEIK